MKKDILEDDDLMSIIISVPKQSVKLNIESTIIDDETDELYHASNQMNLAEITEARIIGNEWENENAVYCLTDEGRRMFENAEI